MDNHKIFKICCVAAYIILFPFILAFGLAGKYK